ncbi:cytochrome P450 9e2 isoform X2 [Plutella xylostella]|uniref:cytochrome P450 9e2 isoform X2 n=1 Tax=Plutella xylostella TaxID=51655 RepID=UPI002032F6D4|nr:cytochrome P450 9e2 isoform X2 [Plutella xylostella]
MQMMSQNYFTKSILSFVFAYELGSADYLCQLPVGNTSIYINIIYFGLYQYHVPTLIPRDPELVRRLVVRDFAAFCDRGVHIPPDCDPLFGRNLIMLRGSKWRSMRASLSPAFSAARSRSMAPLMAECAAATMDYLRIHVETGKEIDTDKIVTAYVNDVIASCAFGFAVDSLQDPTNCIFRLGQTAVVQHTTQVMKFFGYENFPRVMKLLGVKIISTSDADKFAQLFKSALKSRREQQSQPRPDFIQTLVDAAQGKLKDKQEDPNNNEDSTNWTKKFSDDDLVAQAVLFYVAGFDTTANLINYFLYEMAVNPEVQRRLLAEIDEADKSGDLYEAVQGLQYLDMCVNGRSRHPRVATYLLHPPRRGLLAEPRPVRSRTLLPGEEVRDSPLHLHAVRKRPSALYWVPFRSAGCESVSGADPERFPSAAGRQDAAVATPAPDSVYTAAR